MSKIIVGSLVLILFSGMMLVGLEIFDLTRTQAVLNSAVFAARPRLAMDGAASPTVKAIVKENLKAAGLNPDKADFKGSTSTPENYGATVRLEVEYPVSSEALYFLMFPNLQVKSTIITVSEKVPSVAKP